MVQLTLKQTIDKIKEINSNGKYEIWLESHADGLHIIFEESEYTIIPGGLKS